MIYQHSSLLVAAKVVVPDGDDPLNREVEVAVPEWYLLPAMHGPQLRVASKDAPFRFVTPAELADSLLRPAFKEMEINLSKLGTKTMAPRQGAIKHLTEQHTGKLYTSTRSIACQKESPHEQPDNSQIFLVNAVPQERLKEVSDHIVIKTELEGTYTARVCRGIKVLLVAAGYAGDLESSHGPIPFDDFKWQQQFVQGRQLVTWEYMRDAWPAEFIKIVDGLLPGMLELLQQVEQRGKRELSTEESRVSAHVHSGLFFVASFLQLSAWKLYAHPNSPVYTDIPLFREDWFKAFHLEQYCPKVRGFQHMAEAVSQHVLDTNNSCNNVLIRARQQLQMPFNKRCTTAQSIRILSCAYTLVTGEAVSDTEAVAELEPKTAPAPAPLPCAGAHKVALPSADTLRCWWSTWYKGDRGYMPLRDYYSQTRPRVGKPEFLNPSKDPQKVWRRKHLLWELERQIGQGHEKKEVNADKVIRRWDLYMATKACGVDWSVPKLAHCFRALATTEHGLLVTDPACRVDEPEKCQANLAREAFVKVFVQ